MCAGMYAYIAGVYGVCSSRGVHRSTLCCFLSRLSLILYSISLLLLIQLDVVAVAAVAHVAVVVVP